MVATPKIIPIIKAGKDSSETDRKVAGKFIQQDKVVGDFSLGIAAEILAKYYKRRRPPSKEGIILTSQGGSKEIG